MIVPLPLRTMSDAMTCRGETFFFFFVFPFERIYLAFWGEGKKEKLRWGVEVVNVSSDAAYIEQQSRAMFFFRGK